jgi:hypothetical protein
MDKEHSLPIIVEKKMGKETYTAWIGTKKYVFNKTNHMKGNFAQNCEEIARWIHDHRDNLINDWVLCGPW